MSELRNVNIKFVSLVDKAANKKKFCVVKNEENGNFQAYCPIVKVDEEKQEITSVVYEPNVKDAHKDEMTAEEIEKAQRTHMIQGAKSDVQHSFVEEKKLHTVESWVTKQDGTIGGQKIKKGTWMETMYIENPELWEGVKSGKFTGLSMGGTGERINKSVSGAPGLTIDETSSWDARKSENQIWSYVKDIDENIDVAKARKCFMWYDPSMSDTQTGYKLPFVYIKDGSPVAVRNGLIAVNNALSGARGGVDIPQSDIPKIQSKIKAYSNKMNNPIPGFENDVEKSLFKKFVDYIKDNFNIKKENKKEDIISMDINKDELQKMITDTVQKAVNPAPTVEEQVAKALEKAGTSKKEEDKDKNKEKEISENEKLEKAVNGVLKSLGYEQKEETFEEKVAKAVAKAVAPMGDTIEKMAAARGFTKSEEQIQKSKTGIDAQLKKSYLG